MLNSQFLSSNIFERKELLSENGATSLSYRVSHEGKEYFVKQLRKELVGDWRCRAAFLKEYEVGRKIDCKHVVKYIALDDNEEGPYLLMEHVNGTTLEEKLKTNAEYFAQEAHFERLFLQLLNGLSSLHKARIAHLDIKPTNVMITQLKNDAIIIDLGCCFADSNISTSGYTPMFAAPELLKGDLQEIDERTDIYALGCLMQYVKDVSCARISKRMQKIIARCTNPVKEERFANTEEVIRSISRLKKKISIILLTTFLITALLVGIYCIRVTIYYYSNKFFEEVGWMLRNPDYDIKIDGNKYQILSMDSLTCEIVGATLLNDLYVAKEVDINGKNYHVTKIGDESFAGCGLRSVFLPDGVKVIGRSAFSKCRELISLHLPASVTLMEQACFYHLDNLESLVLSPNTKVIPNNAFTECTKLEQLTIPEGVESIGLDAFALCKGLKKVSLPSTLQSLKRGSFWRCEQLTEITIPASVNEIGEYTFFDCSNLKNIYNYAPVPQVVPPIFNGSVTVHVPKGAEELYRNAENWSQAKIVGIE